MKATMKVKGNECLFWHRWELAKDTGFTRYYKCKDCAARHVRQPEGSIYQPIDTDWLTGKTDSI